MQIFAKICYFCANLCKFSQKLANFRKKSEHVRKETCKFYLGSEANSKIIFCVFSNFRVFALNCIIQLNFRRNPGFLHNRHVRRNRQIIQKISSMRKLLTNRVVPAKNFFAKINKLSQKSVSFRKNLQISQKSANFCKNR